MKIHQFGRRQNKVMPIKRATHIYYLERKKEIEEAKAMGILVVGIFVLQK